jgi:hypothetical protein
VSSQAPGRSGVPLNGQCSSACANASWTTPPPRRCRERSAARRTPRARTPGGRPRPRARVCHRPASTRGRSLPRAEMLPDPPALCRARASRRRAPPTTGAMVSSRAASHRPDRAHLDEATLAKRDLLRPLDGFLPFPLSAPGPPPCRRNRSATCSAWGLLEREYHGHQGSWARSGGHSTQYDADGSPESTVGPIGGDTASSYELIAWPAMLGTRRLTRWTSANTA